MLLERTAQPGNTEVVGEAYDIAAYYLKMSGYMQDTVRINEYLLEIVYELYQAGDRNKIRLANRAIRKFGRRRAGAADA